MLPIIPKPGTPGYDDFVRKAKKAGSMESKIMTQLVEDASAQTQNAVRGMLHQMIDLVPGQLFRDIVRFHEKFGVRQTQDHGHKIVDDAMEFRLKFLMEELNEYATAVGARITSNERGTFVEFAPDADFNVEDALDALIDLVYVALGTAYMHRFPFNEGWARVQAANMAKERATSADDERSKRKHSIDIVKPEGWKPPVLTDLLDEVCDECDGRGKYEVSSSPTPGDYSTYDVVPCTTCNKSGRVKRKVPSAG